MRSCPLYFSLEFRVLATFGRGFTLYNSNLIHHGLYSRLDILILDSLGQQKVCREQNMNNQICLKPFLFGGWVG